jgi:DNA end-binding protein Ku
MRAAWKGYITIGQLGVPVRLFSATRSIRPQFNLLHEKDGSPVDRVLRCHAEDKDITIDETVRAIATDPGRYITFTTRELEQAAEEHTKSIEVKQFADVSDVNPLYYEKPFYIVPSRGGEKAYALLREAMLRTKKIAIVQFVIYNQNHIATISTHDDLLLLYQLRFSSEIIPRFEIRSPALSKPSPAEIEMLTKLIDRYSGPFYAEDYHDEQSERILALAESKTKGLPPPKKEPRSPHATPEDELLPALRLSLEASKDD